MERTNEQKVLNIFAIIDLIVGILNILLGILTIFGGGLAIDNAAQIASETSATIEQATDVGNLFIGQGIASLIMGVSQIITFVLLKKFINDPTKHKALTIVTAIPVVLSIIGLVLSIMAKDSQLILNNFTTILINGYILYLINKTKVA